MHSKILLISFVFIAVFAVSSVRSDEELDEEDPFVPLGDNNKKLTKQQIIALSRDYYGRENPDLLVHGFFPVWAVGVLGLSLLFLVVAIISYILYLLGCKSERPERIAQRARSKSVTSGSMMSSSRIGVNKN